MSAPTWVHGLALLILVIALAIVYRRFVPRGGKAAGRAWRRYGDDDEESPSQSGTGALTPSR
jgi:membrane protein implicated in regulation of membrane protease activity